MNPPKGYHKIKVHLVFAVNFDGRHKARLLADGHLTLRLVIFLGKINNLDIWELILEMHTWKHWLCPEDKALFNQVQDQGTGL